MKRKKSQAITSAKMEKLGRYLIQLREDLGYTLQDVAKLSGISRGYLCKLEHGMGCTAGIDVLLALSRAYSVPLSAICREADFTEESENFLPPFDYYLRCKFRLSSQAIRDLEIAKEVVEKKYNRGQLDLFAPRP